MHNRLTKLWCERPKGGRAVVERVKRAVPGDVDFTCWWRPDRAVFTSLQWVKSSVKIFTASRVLLSNNHITSHSHTGLMFMVSDCVHRFCSTDCWWHIHG